MRFTKNIFTCDRPTVAPLAAALWWGSLLAHGGTAGGWSWRGDGTGTGYRGREGVWAREVSAASVGLTPHLVWDAVAALIALLPVPCVTRKLTSRLLFMELREIKKKKLNMEECLSDIRIIIQMLMTPVNELCPLSLSHTHICKYTYLMHVKCMDAHLSGCIFRKDQTSKLTLPCTAAWTHSSGISPIWR